MSTKKNNRGKVKAEKMTKTYSQEELDQMEEFDEDDEEFEDEDEYEDDTEDEDEPEDENPARSHVLSLQEIVDVDDTREEELFIPEWGGCIVVKGLNKNEFDHMRRQSKMKSSRGRSQEILEREITVAGVVTPRISLKDYNLLLERSAGVMVRILNKVMEKSGLGEEAEKMRERRFPRK